MPPSDLPAQPAPRPIRNYGSLLAAGLVLTVYLLAYLWLPRQVFWSPDEGVRYMMAHVLAQRGLDIEDTNQSLAAKFHPSIFNGPGFMYPTVRANGKVNYPWPILFPLLAGYAERLFGFEGIYLLPLLSAWLPASLGHYFVTEGMYAVDGPETFNHWLTLAQSEGIETFFLVSKVPFNAVLSADPSIHLTPGSQRVINGLFFTSLQIEGGS